MNLRIARGFWIAVLVTAGLQGQTTGSKTGSATATTPTAPTTGRLPSATSPTTTLPPTQQDIQRPIYISGKVVLNDGQPPPDSATMQLLCNGSPRSVGYTDSKGRFSIDLGNKTSSAVFADASQDSFGRMGSNGSSSQLGGFGGSSGGAGSSRGVSSLAGCELYASLPGFRSDRVNLSNRQSLDNPEVGTLILHRLGNVEGLTISATTAMAPKDARKAFDKGRGEAKKEKWENAEREFQKAVDAYPKYAAAWFELGLAQQHQSKAEAARKSYGEAVACDPKFVSPRMQLALMAAKDKKWDEVEATTKHLLKLNPVDFPQAWYFNSLANFHLEKLDLAAQAASKGVDADTQHTVPKLDQLLGVLLANKGDYPGALQHLNAYLTLVPEAPDGETVKKQIAQLRMAMKPEAAR
jgi:Flp pilus assembly protein TadD